MVWVFGREQTSRPNKTLLLQFLWVMIPLIETLTERDVPCSISGICNSRHCHFVLILCWNDYLYAVVMRPLFKILKSSFLVSTGCLYVTSLHYPMSQYLIKKALKFYSLRHSREDVNFQTNSTSLENHFVSITRQVLLHYRPLNKNGKRENISEKSSVTLIYRERRVFYSKCMWDFRFSWTCN